jgi:serine/threonine-protein kinase
MGGVHADERADALVNTMLGKDYRVIEPIGFGGMAVVYLVEHQTLLKRFAAKVLSVELTKNFEARARFTAEAHAASQLDHENIVNISDFGVTMDHRPFFVMELLRGQTLDQRLADGPMTLEEIVAVSVPVGNALAFAHAEGIVHRDVKPENIFLVQRSQGRWGIKVVDFGIAKTPISDRLTKMGQTLGSPHFMSPEACRGEDVDHRADIYSYGVILYLMTTGRLPFDDPSLLKVLQLHNTQALVPPAEINPALPPQLCAVIERALAKNPDDRYASMEMLLIDFEASIPPGAERMLVEQQAGTNAAFRTTPFPHQSQPMRTVSDSVPPVTLPIAPAPKSRGALYAVLGLLIVAAIGGGIFVMQQGGSEEKPSAPPAPVAKVEPTPPDPLPPPPKVETEKPRVVGAPKETTRHYQIDTKPDRATVTLDGESLGVTPLSIDRAIGDGNGELVISKNGYQSVTKEIRLDSDVTLDIELSRKVAAVEPRNTKPDKKVKPPPKPGSDAPPPTKGDPTLDIRLSR